MKGKKIVPHLLAGAVIALVAAALKQIYGYVPSAEEGVAAQTIVSALISALTPDRLEADE